jgi:hypothetical protein
MNHTNAPVGTREAAALVAELNDLLQLDHDAVAAYALALNALEDPVYQEDVRRFKQDHERHIDELTELIHSFGGMPMPLPHASGVFKLAVQAVGATGGDAAVIRAFKANETQSRDKYRRAASKQHPPEVQGVLIRAARDEQRHFDWAMRTLGELGVDMGSVADALEQMHARTADTVEAVERGAMHAAELARRRLRDSRALRVVAGGLMLAGAAAAVTVLVRRR